MYQKLDQVSKKGQIKHLKQTQKRARKDQKKSEMMKNQQRSLVLLSQQFRQKDISFTVSFEHLWAEWDENWLA